MIEASRILYIYFCYDFYTIDRLKTYKIIFLPLETFMPTKYFGSQSNEITLKKICNYTFVNIYQAKFVKSFLLYPGPV